MTRAEIIADLENMIGPSSEVDGAGLATWVNDAYMQMVDAITQVNPDFFLAVSTTDTQAGDQEYDTPDDFERAVMVNIAYDGTNWVRALPIQNIGDVAVHANTASYQGFNLAQPGYYIAGDQIGILPIPADSHDENIKLWYIYTPEALEDDADEPAIPKKYHYIIKYGAYANYLDQDDEHAAAERMRLRFDELVGRMVEGMSSSQIDQPKTVMVTDTSDLYMDSDYV